MEQFVETYKNVNIFYCPINGDYVGKTRAFEIGRSINIEYTRQKIDNRKNR